MAGTGSGIKNQNRLTSYLTPLFLYRVVTSADGAVNPASPPAISLIDASASPRGLNDLVLFITPAAGDTPTLQLWVVVDSAWFFVVQQQIGLAGRPERWVVKDLPSCKWAVVVTTAAGPVSISCARTD